MNRACAIALMILTCTVMPGCEKPPERKPKTPPMKVVTVEVKRGDLSQRLHVSGPLRFIANTTVSAEVSAQVRSIVVSDGDAVHEGQLLLIFDDTKIMETSIHAASELRKDEAILEFARKEYDKHLALSKSGSVSQTTLDQKRSEHEHAEARVEMDRSILAKAMQDLKKTRVKAPVSGRISDRFIEQGDWVEEGGKLFRISDHSKVYLEAHLSDLDLAKLDVKRILREGIPAEVVVDAYPDRVFQGTLSYIEPVANAARLFEGRVYIDNPDMLLLQGMFGRCRLVYQQVSKVLKLPLTALLDPMRGSGANTVFTVGPEKRARLKKITVGASNRTYTEVRSGLQQGDAVVTQGKEVLNDGRPVEPVSSLVK
jgi:membrane fusion protein (multidrug efflux system)